MIASSLGITFDPFVRSTHQHLASLDDLFCLLLSEARRKFMRGEMNCCHEGRNESAEISVHACRFVSRGKPRQVTNERSVLNYAVPGLHGPPFTSPPAEDST